MEKLIHFLKNRRKRSYISKKHIGTYAFVGIGNHSINNLYPILNYHHISLKYIVTKGQKNAKYINDTYTNTEGTNDFQKVLLDPDIKGIFICAHPQSHYTLVKQALIANKNVFVEKPPCLSSKELADLIEIEKQSKGSVVVGFQKCYAPAINQLLKQDLLKSNFNYQYITGQYPEGDPLFDLFIHPLSVINLLYKNIQIVSVLKYSNKKGQTLLLHFKHDKGIGSSEFSCNYSWENAHETLKITTLKGQYCLEDTDKLIYEELPGQLFGLPKEKLFGHQTTQKTIYNRNTFVPIFSNNQIVSSGYYSEITTFVDLCEGKKISNLTTLSSLSNLFNMIDTIISHTTQK